MMRVVPDDKRTKMGPTGPVRAVTPSYTPGPVAAVAPALTIPGRPAATPAPITDPPSAPPGHATSYLPPATDPMLGQVLAGRYLIQRKLGEGGMGAVYLATHNLLEKHVALKVLHGEFARKPDLVERFMQEAKSASRIRHENVIDISHFGTTPEGLVFFAMELLQGHDLHEEIARARLAGQLLPWERSKRIFLQICAALGAAHALGIVHRDLKPENIYLVEFLGEPDFVKLLDFGIAKLTEVADGDRKLTRTGMLFGTPEYMSPEQARGEPVDHRVDIYAMGCILFQLVTGRVPFEAENFMGVLSLHLTEPPPAIPLEVFDSIGAPRALAAVIDQALAKDRNQRFQSVDDLARAVRRASGDKATGPVTAQANVAAPGSLTGRVKTQWTGNLSIPESDAPAQRRSKLPLVVGAIIVVGSVAAAAAVVATRGGDSSSGTPGVSAPAAVQPGPPATPRPPTPSPPSTPPAPPAAEARLPFERTQIRLDSAPSHADVKDLARDLVVGTTPFTFSLPSSHTARQFGLHRKGYIDAVIEIVPDREKIEYTEKLERGAADAPAVVHRATEAPAPGLPTRPATPSAASDSVPPPPARPVPSPTAPPVPPATPRLEPTGQFPTPPKPESPPPTPEAPTPPHGDAIPLKPFGSGSSTP